MTGAPRCTQSLEVLPGSSHASPRSYDADSRCAHSFSPDAGGADKSPLARARPCPDTYPVGMCRPSSTCMASGPSRREPKGRPIMSNHHLTILLASHEGEQFYNLLNDVSNVSIREAVPGQITQDDAADIDILYGHP